jgi:hypothetical protein
MMGPTTLREIRAQLCRRLGIADEDLDEWMHRTARKGENAGEPCDAELKRLLKQLDDAVAKAEKEPSRPRRKGSRARTSDLRQTPKTS